MDISRRRFLETGLIGGAALTAAGCASSLPTATSGRGWQIGYQNAPAAGYGSTTLKRVYGKAPSGLSGSLYRNGPAQFRYGDQYASHWFDGDGLVHRIAFDGGQAVHSGKFVQTVKHKAEQAAGKFLAPGFGTLGDPNYAVMGPDDVNAANTSVLMVNGELLALWEAGSAIAMDAETLETKGPKVWRDDLAAMPFLAHPKVEPSGRVWNLAVSGPNVGIYRIAPNGVMEDFGLVNIGEASYIHDWAMTDRKLVILVQPWINEALRPPVVDGFEWKPELGLKILIVDKNDLTNQRWSQAPARAFFHTGSAWEESDGTIRLDVALYKEPVLGPGGGTDEIRGKWTKPDPAFLSDLTQIVIPQTGDARLVETGIDGEFPQVHPAFSGQRRRLTALVAQAAKSTPGATALSVHDWESGKTSTFDFGEGRMVEEFLFVPKPGGTTEFDSWLIGPVLNTKAGATEICVFDAASVSDGPVCIYRADYAWPLGFHGTWA